MNFVFCFVLILFDSFKFIKSSYHAFTSSVDPNQSILAHANYDWGTLFVVYWCFQSFSFCFFHFYCSIHLLLFVIYLFNYYFKSSWFLFISQTKCNLQKKWMLFLIFRCYVHSMNLKKKIGKNCVSVFFFVFFSIWKNISSYFS